MFGGDDDDDFTPASNSKLASLFGRPVEEGGNSSLTYTAPKQPKKTKNDPIPQSAGQVPKLSIIIVKAVHTYKLEDGNYNTQGKLGAAVLGNSASRLYQLLLYRNQQQHITTTKITDKFQFTVQTKNFASFYDDKGQNWSIMFENEQDAVVFAKEIGLARACALGEQDPQPFYVQDLKVGEGTQAELGDFLEVRYTCSPLLDSGMSDAIENNLEADKPQRVKIRKGVWEEALIGSARGCKKLIVLAPVLFGPWKPLVDPAHRLVVEVEIGRVKAARKSAGAIFSGMATLTDSAESNVDSGTDETSIKARGASISEALTNSPKTHKASIISRMARMGQATLPLKGAVVANPSDSEETEEESSGTGAHVSFAPSKPILKNRMSTSKPRSLATASAVPTSTDAQQTCLPENTSAVGFNSAVTQQVAALQLAWPQQMTPHAHQYMVNRVPIAIPAHADGQLYATATPHQMISVQQPLISTPSGTPSSESHMAVYLSENRTHNAEIRMGLTKVIDKVDQALVKLDGLQQQQIPGVLDAHTLLASIQKLVADNEHLKAEVADKRLKLEQQNEKMYQLLHHKYLEQSSVVNPVDQRQEASLQAMVIALQQENARLSAELKDALTKASSVQFQSGNLDHMREEMNNLTIRLQSQQVELERSKQTIMEQESLMRSLRERNEASTLLHNTQESAIANLKVNIKELEASKGQLEAAVQEARQQADAAAERAAEQLAALEEANKEKVDKLQKELEGAAGGDRPQKNSAMEEMIKRLQENKRELTEKITSLEVQLKAAEQTNRTTEKYSTIDDVKKVMSVMYKLLKSEFLSESKYDGSSVRETILSTIQEVTLQYLKMKAKAEAHSHRKEGEKSTEREELKAAQSNPEIEEGGSSTLETIPSHYSENIDKGDPPAEMEQNVTKKSDVPEEHPYLIVTYTESTVGEKVKPDTKAAPVPPTNPPVEETERNPVAQSKEAKAENGGGPKESLCEESSQHAAKLRDVSLDRGWRPQPPPSPLFDDEEDDDDWLT